MLKVNKIAALAIMGTDIALTSQLPISLEQRVLFQLGTLGLSTAAITVFDFVKNEEDRDDSK